MASSSSQRLSASSLVNTFRRGASRRQADEAATLDGQLATVAMQGHLLLLAHAIDHQERSCLRKWASTSLWGSRLSHSGLSEPRYGTTPWEPGRGENLLPSALDHVLLVDRRIRGSSASAPAERTHTSPPGKGRAGIFSRSPPGPSGRLRLDFAQSLDAGFKGQRVRLDHAPGIMLSRSALTSPREGRPGCDFGCGLELAVKCWPPGPLPT